MTVVALLLYITTTIQVKLSIFNKLLEKLMANRLVKFLEENNILYKNQFGLRSYHSTDFAILSIIDKIQSAIDASDYSCGIFLDCSKAFDTIVHQLTSCYL